jgi:peptidoglycan-associated lipoprotein
MNKFSVFSLLVAAALFTTGCSEKNVGMDVNNGMNQNSENALNSLPDTQVNTMQPGDFDFAEKVDNGAYYLIGGEKVLLENVYFAFDKYDLSSDMKAVVDSNATKLSALTSQTTIKVSGNTDEWGTDEYNYALGLKRAKTVKDALTNGGVAANISLVSLGESNPTCTEKTQDCWQKNRRVEHTLAK